MSKIDVVQGTQKKIVSPTSPKVEKKYVDQGTLLEGQEIHFIPEVQTPIEAQPSGILRVVVPQRQFRPGRLALGRSTTSRALLGQLHSPTENYLSDNTTSEARKFLFAESDLAEYIAS